MGNRVNRMSSLKRLKHKNATLSKARHSRGKGRRVGRMLKSKRHHQHHDVNLAGSESLANKRWNKRSQVMQHLGDVQSLLDQEGMFKEYRAHQNEGTIHDAEEDLYSSSSSRRRRKDEE